MKVAALLFMAFVACASAAAVPAPIETRNDALVMSDSSRNTRFVDGIVASAIESVSQNIRDAGLDPFVMEKFDIGYQLPVPILFNGAGSVSNLQVTGVSNIVIKHINFAVLTTRLTFDISLPEIVLSLDDAWFDLTFFGHNFAGRTTSRLAIVNLGLIGDIRLNLGVLTGISVRDIDMNFYYGDLQYNGFATLFGYDITPLIDNLIHQEIPATIAGLYTEINELIEIIVTQVINDLA